MTDAVPAWLSVARGSAPLVVSIPHTGTEIPVAIADRLVSPWLARKDADWWVEHLYGFAEKLGATVVRTAISRTVIDVNRDPSGASLYPGQATTGLCPTTSFDGEPLYQAGAEPDSAEVAERRGFYFEPYHTVLSAEIDRLRQANPRLVLYDCHSIRSVVPRLFQGALPNLNLGTNDGRSCDSALEGLAVETCRESQYGVVLNGRFTGGWITRHYGNPATGVSALQMELACRGYMNEPADVGPDNWPTPYDPHRAEPMRAFLEKLLRTLLGCAENERTSA